MLTTIEKMDTPALTRFERRKEEILHVAAALFNRNGLRDTTLAIVAGEIGLSLKSLRYYFKKREDLVGAAFLESIALHRALVADAESIDQFDDRIRHFVRSYFALQARVRSGEQAEFVHFGDLRALTQPHFDIVGDAYVEMFRHLRQLFKPGECAWTSAERSANAHLLLSQLFWSVIWIDGYLPEDYARAADKLCDILLDGLAGRVVDLSAADGEIPTPFFDSERLSHDSFLRTATHLINEIGYRGASVDRISSALSVTKGAFYHHNETRDGLVVACFERTFDIVRQAQDRAMAEDMNGLGRVAAAAVTLVGRQMSAEGALLRTSALTAIGPELRTEMARRMTLLTWRFADMLNDGMSDRSVRICDIRIASEMVTAMINSAQELQRWVPSADASNAVTLYLGPLLNGFLASRGAEES